MNTFNNRDYRFRNMKQINKYYSVIPNGDIGENATIYEFNTEYLLKIFLHKINWFNVQKLESFCNILTYNITFPKGFIYIKNDIVGYKMFKKNGVMLSNLDENYLLKDIIDALSSLEYEINYISRRGVKMLDLHSKNVLYDNSNRCINIIDTDDYGLVKEREAYNNLLQYNLYSIFTTIYDMFSKLPNFYQYYKNFKVSDFNSIKDVQIALLNYIKYTYNEYKIYLESYGDVKQLKL